MTEKVRNIAVALAAVFFMTVSGHAWAQPNTGPGVPPAVSTEAVNNIGQESEVAPQPWGDFWFRCTPLPYGNRQVFVYTEFDNSLVDHWADYTVRLRLKRTINSRVVVQDRVTEVGPGEYRNDVAAFVLQEPVYISPQDGEAYRLVKASILVEGGNRQSMPWVKASSYYKNFACPLYRPIGAEG